MRNTVDSPSGDPENEPELANETEETTEGRGATTGAPTWGTDRVVTTQPVGDAHLAALATVTGTMPEVAQRQQQSPSIIVQDSPRTLNLFDSVAHSPVTHPQPLTQLHTETTPTAVCRSRPTERRHASQRRCSSSRSSSTEVRRHHRIRPQQFNGAGSFESFWANFENCATYNKWKEADKLAHLKASLTGDAAQVLWDTDAAAVDTVERLVTLLRNRFSGTCQSEKYRMELRIRRRQPGEQLSTLHQDIRRLMALAHPTLSREGRETFACDYFIDALDDADFALKVRERTPASLDDALRISQQLEAWIKDARRGRRDDVNTTKLKVRGASEPEVAQHQLSNRLDRIEGDVHRCLDGLRRLNGPGLGVGNPGAYPESQPEPAKSKPAPVNGPNATGRPRSNRSTQLTCWKCGLPGHLQRNCVRPIPQHGSKVAQSNNGAVLCGTKGNDNDPRYLHMQLNGRVIACLLDTGCDVTLVPQSVISVARHLAVTPCTEYLQAANGTQIAITGKVIIPFKLNGHRIRTRASVSPDVDETMLGADWMGEHSCLWDFKNGTITIDGSAPIPLSKRHTLRCRRVILQEDTVLPPRHQIDVVARTTFSERSQLLGDYVVDSHRVRPGLYVGRTLVPCGELHDQKVRMVNTTPKPQKLRSGFGLGNMSPVEVVVAENLSGAPLDSDANATPVARTNATTGDAPLPVKVTQSLLDKLPDDLTEQQRNKVNDLLNEFDLIFSKGPYDMGRTKLVEHTIDTGNHRPIRQGLRRHPLAHLEVIDRQVDEMVRNDIVEPAASPWASNVVLVRKKDGSYRLCVDYRALNSVTHYDTYPLPHIDTCLGSMDGAVWFSTLDLRSGYHNIPIRESDRDKTAFITRRGCFRYKVLPFGCSTAPSVFQRLMDLVLCGLTYVTCLVYLDDIIVYANDFETHLERVREVFSRLRDANLKLHATKCCLFQRRVDFLGHVLSERGIEVQEEKVAVVRNWPPPRNLSELRSYLGLCSYYRRFAKGFADVAAPLYKLQKKNATFVWGKPQQDAFVRLKEMLISAPILGMPTDAGKFYLDCDASDVGLGAVLSQNQDGAEVVIAYASRTLSRPESNYDVTKRELLAIIFGLKTFRQYLLGRKFVIRTDHSALQWLRRTPEPMGQLARWLTFVEQFQFELIHRPGAKHGNADGLSRRPDAQHDARGARLVGCCPRAFVVSAPNEAQLAQQSVSHSAGEHPPSSDSDQTDLAIQQQNDAEIGYLVRLRLSQTHPPAVQDLASQSESAKELSAQWNQLEVHNGLVYRRWARQGDKNDVLQLLVPAAARKNFLKRTHAGMTGGHLGIKRTLDQVRRRAYWRGWRRDVRQFCRQCNECNSYFRGTLPRSAPLQPMLTGEPFEKLHIDITGPHPRSRRGSQWILTCIDPFSKWAEAFPLPNKEAATVARVLVEQVICRFGAPVAGISDRGKEVDGNLMAEVCRLLDIDKMRTTAYRPNCNGVVERFHATLNSIMGRLLDENQADWDAQLPYVMAAYRASQHEATKFTPNYLILGREVRAPVDLVYGTPEMTRPVAYATYADELDARMRQAYTLVRENLGVAAQRNKRAYDLRVHAQTYKVGEWVRYFHPRKMVNRQDKWRRKFNGPFLVVKVIGPVNVMIQRSRRAHPFCVHIDKLKPYVAECLPKSWLSEADAPSLGALEQTDTATDGEEAQPIIDAQQTTDGQPDDGGAIAGAPSATQRSPRPKRDITRPKRFLE